MKKNGEDALDSKLLERMNKRYVELAAMFKEYKKGSLLLKKKIVAKFCLQEGLRLEKGEEYCKTLIEAGLVTFTDGAKMWKYHPEEEWELFKVNII